MLYRTRAFKFLEQLRNENFLDMLQHETGFFVAEDGGIEELFAYARSKGYREFGGVEWILLVGHDREEVLQSAFALRNTMMTASLLLILLSILIALLISRSITTPLLKLSEGADIIGKGNLRHRVELQSTDEIGELATAFNQMTARRQVAEEALRESEARWQFALEGAGDGIWDSNVQTNTVFSSPQAKSMLGFEEHEIGDTLEEWEKLIHPEDSEYAYAELNKHLTGQSPMYRAEYRVQCKDGTYKWLLDRGKVLRWTEDGKPLRVIGTYTDITERKLAEQRNQAHLRFLESMDRVNRAIQGTKDIEQMMHDELNVVLSIFESDRAFLGYPCDPQAPSWRIPMERTRQEYPGAIAELEIPMSEDDANLNRTLLASGGPVTFGPGPDFDRPLPSELTESFGIQSQIIMAIYPNVGKPWTFGTHQCSYRHIWTPEEKQLLQAIGHRLADGLSSLLAYRELRQSERLLADIAANYPHSYVSIIEKDFTISFTSGQEFKKQQLDRKSVEGLSLDRVFGEQAPTAREHYRNAFQGKETSFELFMHNQYYLHNVVPLYSHHDHVTCILDVAENITERKQAEEELRKYRDHLEELVAERTAELEHSRKAALSLMQSANEQRQQAEEAQKTAEAANRAKSEFLANMSHELRTPMNAILGFAQLMQRDTALTEAQWDHLSIITRSGDHLLKLINDVLDMSKIEAGQIELNPQMFDLYQILTSLEEMVRVRAERKGLSFTVTRAPNVPQYITTDESKLRQVLINLLGNAIKFTEKGSILLTIEACQWHIDDEKGKGLDTHSSLCTLRFSIQDTGIGIALDELETIFETFRRIHSSQATTEGTGLGLAISRTFVHLMGGDIYVASTVGKGSCFRFDIQVEPADINDFQAVQPIRRVIGLKPNQPTYRLLIVEDHPENRVFLTQLLQTVGFAIHEAANGQEAIEQYESWQPHLIWMDIRMPVMDGYEATREIRRAEVEKSSRTVIVALSASAFEEDRLHVIEAGCDDFVRKPIQEADIFDAMHKHLGVQYVYEETGKVAGGKQKTAKVLTPEALAALPQDVLARVEESILGGDVDLIEQVIDDIRDVDARVADALTPLAQQFEYDKMLAVLQDAKGMTHQ